MWCCDHSGWVWTTERESGKRRSGDNNGLGDPGERTACTTTRDLKRSEVMDGSGGKGERKDIKGYGDRHFRMYLFFQAFRAQPLRFSGLDFVGHRVRLD